MPDEKEGGIQPAPNTQETSQAEGDQQLGETDRKVGRTRGQAEGDEETVDEDLREKER
ncbi:MAG: hypothetical protein MUF87_14435 [Anaerolineae bacterium]|jgi:hypothetical protein|nr:hypothetical protein [Anaerolineae bacterium]